MYKKQLVFMLDIVRRQQPDPNTTRVQTCATVKDDIFPNDDGAVWDSWETSMIYPFDCEGIVAGNKTSIQKAQIYARKHKRPSLAASKFVSLTRNCTNFKNRRGYVAILYLSKLD